MSVDIGTSYSTACICGQDGFARPVEISTGASMFGSRFSLPTAVFLEEDGDILVGQAAMNSRMRKPENFRMEFKRNFGETCPILLGNRSFLPENLYTELFRHMKACAEKACGEKIELTYLTHPAAYGRARIEKLRSAANAAGLFEVETVDEPTAAAMSYCAAGYIQDGQTLLVYDFGGGTFDVSLIRYENGMFTSLGNPEGLEQCGGIDMDRLIYQDMLKAVDPDILSELQSKPRYFMQFSSQLAELAVKAKHHLSAAKVFEEPIIVGLDTVPYQLTVEQFNKMVAPLVGQTVTTCHLALEKAGLTSADLSAVLLVGGTSRVPLVQDMVKQFAGSTPVHRADDLELAVAQGAIKYQQFRAKPEELAPEEIEAWRTQGCRMFAEGNWEEAVSWFCKAAEQGDAEAQLHLGVMYSEGLGVEQSNEKAAEWYRKAAEQGNADAQVVLGCCYEFGDGLPIDLKKAALWYGLAGKQGHEKAAAALERLHLKGREKKPEPPEEKPKAEMPTLDELAVAAVKAELARHAEITKGADAFSEASLDRLRMRLKIPPLADVLLAHDAAGSKSEKSGFALTSLGIYSREPGLLARPAFTSWDDFVRLDLTCPDEFPRYLDLSNGARIEFFESVCHIYLSNDSLVCYFCGDTDACKPLLAFWKDLQQRLRADARRELGMDV